MVSVAVIVTPNTRDAPESVPRRIFESVPEIEIELVRFVPIGDAAVPYVWVKGDDLRRFERTAHRYPEVSTVERLERVDGGALYRIEWNIDSPIVRCIEEAGGTLVEAHGNADRWEFTVWFDERSTASTLLQCCNNRDVPIDVERYHSVADAFGDPTQSVTPQQREALVVAYENGYFEEPRGITQTALAERLDISTAAVGSRLRRGTRNLVERALIE